MNFNVDKNKAFKDDSTDQQDDGGNMFSSLNNMIDFFGFKSQKDDKNKSKKEKNKSCK